MTVTRVRIRDVMAQPDYAASHNLTPEYQYRADLSIRALAGWSASGACRQKKYYVWGAPLTPAAMRQCASIKLRSTDVLVSNWGCAATRAAPPMSLKLRIALWLGNRLPFRWAPRWLNNR